RAARAAAAPCTPGCRSSRTRPPARSRSGRSRSPAPSAGLLAAASGTPPVLLPPAGHQLGEAGEQRVGVVRAGRGLGMVLDAEPGHVQALQALEDAVVAVAVGDARARRQARVVDGEAVVVAGDAD